MTEAGFRKAVEATRSGLSIWNYSGDVLDLLLRVGEIRHAAAIREAPTPAAVARLSRVFQDGVGVLVRWGLEGRRGHSVAHPPGGPSRKHLKWASEAVDLAVQWSKLEEALILLDHGFLSFESSGNTVRLSRTTDVRWEALDRQIGRPFGRLPDLSSVADEMQHLRDWAKDQEIGQLPDMPDREFASALRIARVIRGMQEREFPNDTLLGDFTLAEAHAVWDVLFAYASVAATLTTVTLNPESAILSPSKAVLVMDLASATGLPESKVRSVLDFITFRPDCHPDPAIAPLVEDGDGYLIPPILVTMSNFERNRLRAVALNPALEGPIGDERGRTAITSPARPSRPSASRMRSTP